MNVIEVYKQYNYNDRTFITRVVITEDTNQVRELYSHLLLTSSHSRPASGHDNLSPKFPAGSHVAYMSHEWQDWYFPGGSPAQLVMQFAIAAKCKTYCQKTNATQLYCCSMVI